MAVENGLRDDGAVVCSKDDVRCGVIGCRANGGGEDGGVNPEPDGGSSGSAPTAGVDDKSLTVTTSSTLDSSEPSTVAASDGALGASFPLIRTILVEPSISSRMMFWTETPYGE